MQALATHTCQVCRHCHCSTSLQAGDHPHLDCFEHATYVSLPSSCGNLEVKAL